jgi:DNA (cytosine-5)-methyltransferase 1
VTRRIGSMFAGLGGLDLACEWELGGTTAWQLDLVGADIRRRHFPDALQVEADVRTVDPLDLPPIDVLCGGFPCTDLSVAGQQAGLDGEKSGLYSEVLRFAHAIRPEYVVLENVPALLQYRERLETDWDALGYGLTWVQARALDAGAPHRRARVFVVARLGGPMVGVLEAPRDGEWTWDAERPWATVTAANPNDGEVRAWPTVLVADAKGVKSHGGRGNPSLGNECRQFGKRLNPDWTEVLMGLPQGWTEPTGPRLTAERAPLWPRGRYPETWDRSVLWPGFDWEPPRTIPDGQPMRGRPARIRACGNAVVPQQGALAIRAGLDGPRQLGLF